MKSLAQKSAIVFCFIMAFFLGCVILREPWLFFGVFMISGTVAAIYFAVIKRKKFKAVAIVVIFGLVGLFGHNLYQTVNQWIEPKMVQAATESAPIQTPAPTEQPAVEENSSVVEAPCVYQDRYPSKVLQWCHLVEYYAEKKGMDPLLIAAVIVQESGGDSHAGLTVQTLNGVEYHTSGSGAVGLMQVMPKDGISGTFTNAYGVPYFSDRPTVAELYDSPDLQIEWGIHILRDNVDLYGDIREALYHYGPLDVGYKYADQVLAIYKSIRGE